MARSRRSVQAVAAAALVLLASAAFAGVAAGISARTSGEGAFDVRGMPGEFAMVALASSDRGAKGSFRYELIFQGQLVDFDGAVTCVTFDAEHHRAWIGGVVTANRSVHPTYTTPRTQPGRDIWFRVVDYGEGAASPPDRTSFVGFEGDAEILTSAEYCAEQPWPMDPPDDRTWPVTSGNIQVRP